MQASWGTFQGPVGEMAISWWEGRGPRRIWGAFLVGVCVDSLERETSSAGLVAQRRAQT